MSKSREQVVDYLSKIDISGKTVLDVGCGPERYHAKNFVKGEAGHYATLDINKEFNPDYVVDLNKDVGRLHFDYDVVFCLETLEHIYNPTQAVKNLSQWTKEVCYISVPFINPIHNHVDYLRYTGEWFEEVLPKVGFKSVEIKTREATVGKDLLYSFYRAEGLRMSKIRYKAGEGHKLNDIGYFVVAHK